MEKQSSFLPRILSQRLRSQEYTPLSESKSEYSSEEQIHKTLLRQCLLYITLAITFTLLSSTALVILARSSFDSSTNSNEKHTALEYKYVPNYNPSIAPSSPTSCGSTAAEARSLGCHLDLISFTWLRHECFDAELMDEFLAERTWEWSHDTNGTELISEESIRNGDVNRGWVTWEYHLTHCLYTWKKLIRHLERGPVMDFYVTSYNHTRHCAGLLSTEEDVDMNEWNSEFFVQYPLCGKLDL